MSTQVLGQIRYIEVNNVSVEDTRFEGTLRGFSVLAFPMTFTGSTEQEKIDKAMASGYKSPPSNVITIDFPVSRGVTPTNVVSSNVTATEGTISWTAGSAKGKSALLHRNIDDETDDPSQAIYMDYKDYADGLNYTLTDERFGGTLAGHRVTYWVQEFNIVAQGNTEQEKADWLHDNGYGSEWSEKITLNFPASEAKKAKK